MWKIKRLEMAPSQVICNLEWQFTGQILVLLSHLLCDFFSNFILMSVSLPELYLPELYIFIFSKDKFLGF